MNLLLLRLLFMAILETNASHSLAQAALLQELLLQATELSIEEIVGLVDKAQGDVCNDFRRTSLAELTVVLKSLRGFAPEFPYE
jgi:hypothetical protein